MNSLRSSILLLLLSSLCGLTRAQDRLYASNAPWRHSSQQQQSSRYRYSTYREDYTSHFVDFNDAARDRKSRLWQVDLKSRRPNQLSWTSRLVWTHIAVYALQVFRPGITGWGIKLSDRILRGEQLYRLVTPIFLHGGLFHLFTNMSSLQRVGNDVEKLFGSGRYVATYIAAGIAGNIFSAISSPNPSLGASGAVFGIFGAYFVFLSRNEWLLGSAGQRMTNAVTQTIAANIFLGLVNPVIDNWAHIGGAVGGAAMAYYFGPRLYLAELPGGGRVVVDRPVARLPRSIEAIPERVGNRLKRIVRRMQVERYKLDMPEKPWRPHPTSNFQKRNAPNRSIKPRDVDD